MSLPKAFSERMMRILKDEYNNFTESLSQDAPISIRKNPKKGYDTSDFSPIPWTSYGYYLNSRPVFTLDPLFHAGSYYVQEASSMFLEQAIEQHISKTEPLRALDLCAAPGGKSTHLASLLSEESLLVSNEVIKSRANILSENIQKWGQGNIVVTNNDPKDFNKLENFFDVIVVDAPCSGEGMFRKDINARAEWSEENVQLCAERQRRILMDIWDCLKPGGKLIYSTCTYNEQENEQNLAWLTQTTNSTNLKLDLDPSWNVTQRILEGVEGYSFFPHKTRGEGFFLAVVQKEGKPVSGNGKKQKRKKPVFEKPQAQLRDTFIQWLEKPEKWELIQREDFISILPKIHIPALEKIYQQLRVIYGGCVVAEVKKKNVKPLHSFALFNGLNQSAFSCVNLDLHEALSFLKKETPTIPDAPEGLLLICYRNTPLGWAKKIRQRINNNYPKEWRIRMNIPEELIKKTDEK
ncbi:MAG: hypothetical protein ACEPOZ_03215 [Marinifilaceae bacterium]